MAPAAVPSAANTAANPSDEQHASSPTARCADPATIPSHAGTSGTTHGARNDATPGAEQGDDVDGVDHRAEREGVGLQARRQRLDAQHVLARGPVRPRG